jgi:DNA-binding MarR family transcriptional regulator
MQILREIGVISRALDSIANIEFKEYNLAKGQYLYLVRIVENPGIIQDKLADLIKVDRTTTARAVQKLTAKGLVEKKADSQNKKIKKLFATATGNEIATYILKENQYSKKVATQGLNEQERKTLTELLGKVSHNIEADWHAVKKGHKRTYD